MTIQISVARRNAWGAADETEIGTSPKWQFRTGAPAATCAASTSSPAGSLLGTITGPSDWQAAPSSGQAAISGSHTTTASGTGTIGHYLLWNNGLTVVHEQGLVTKAFSIATNGSTAANSNVLNFASTTGVTVGMGIYGTGVPTGATVLSVTGTTVTMSAVSTAGVSSAATILFGDTSGDMLLAETAVTAGVTTITLTSATAIYPGA
jgi:hypothetical protein